MYDLSQDITLTLLQIYSLFCKMGLRNCGVRIAGPHACHILVNSMALNVTPVGFCLVALPSPSLAPLFIPAAIKQPSVHLKSVITLVTVFSRSSCATVCLYLGSFAEYVWAGFAFCLLSKLHKAPQISPSAQQEDFPSKRRHCLLGLPPVH